MKVESTLSQSISWFMGFLFRTIHVAVLVFIPACGVTPSDYSGQSVEVVRFNYDGGNPLPGSCDDGRECFGLHRYALDANCVTTSRYDCVPYGIGFEANNNQVCATYACEEKTIEAAACLAFKAMVYEANPFLLEDAYDCSSGRGCYGHETTHNLVFTVEGEQKKISYVHESESSFPKRLKLILSKMGSVGL